MTDIPRMHPQSTVLMLFQNGGSFARGDSEIALHHRWTLDSYFALFVVFQLISGIGIER